MTSEAPAWSAAWNCFPTFSAVSKKINPQAASSRSCCTRVNASGRRSSFAMTMKISAAWLCAIRSPSCFERAEYHRQVREDDIAHSESRATKPCRRSSARAAHHTGHLRQRPALFCRDRKLQILRRCSKPNRANNGKVDFDMLSKPRGSRCEWRSS